MPHSGTLGVAAALCLAGTLVAPVPGLGAVRPVAQAQPPSQEPSGYREALHFGFSRTPGDAWRLGSRPGFSEVLADDPTAPTSPPGVLEASFPTGWIDDRELLLGRFRQVLGGPSGGLYLSLVFKLSPGWVGGAKGVDNLLVFRTFPDIPDSVSITLFETTKSGVQPSLRLRGLARRYAGSRNPLLAANQAAGKTVAPDAWHRLEILLHPNTSTASDGTLAWWLDGAAMGDYKDITFWNDTKEAVWGIEWFLIGPKKQGLVAGQTIWLDDARVSLEADGDRVVLKNNAVAGDKSALDVETVVTVDGKEKDAQGIEQCVNDTLRSASLAFDNLLPGATCPPWNANLSFADEVVVFSSDDPVVMVGGDPATALWAAGTGDWPTASLDGGPLEVPLVLWITSNGPQDQCLEQGHVAECDLLTANTLYNDNRTGLRFRYVDRRDVRLDQAVQQDIGSSCDAGVQNTPSFVKGALNVYYIPLLRTWEMGVYCSTLGPNVIYISADIRTNTTLAHELGHALGLEHVASAGYGFYFGPDGSPRFTDANLMWQGGEERSTWSLGQAFRMTLGSRSILYLNGLRTLPQRSCECQFTGGGSTCSSLAQFLAESDRDGACPRISRGWRDE